LTSEPEAVGHPIPEWLAPGLNRCLVDGGWRLLVLDSRLRGLLDDHLRQFEGGDRVKRSIEHNKEADALYRLEDAGVVLVIDDSHMVDKQRKDAVLNGKNT
jgi:hypothetical protein